MAPEQSRAEKQLTTAVDVYSLGAILYELLAGEPPFRGSSIAETLEWLQHREPASPRILNPKIDRDLETITLKCLSKTPGDRFGSAEALADDLDRWQRGTPILARPVNSVERLAKWARRKPTIAGLITALAASIFVGIVGMAWLLQKTWQAEQQAGLRADAETRERERAQNAEKLAETQLERAEESLYFNRVSTAYRYWQDGNLVKADELLRISPEKYRNWEWHHLQKLMHPEEDSIPGYAFRLTTDQKRMFVNHHQVVALWDVKAWKELKRIRHTDKQFSHSPDGTRYARFSTHHIQTGTQRAIGVKVFDTDTDTLIWENANLPIVANDIRNVVFSPDNRLIAVCGTQLNCAQGGEAGSTTVVLDGDTGATKYTLKQGGIHAAFSPDGKTLAAYEERMELDRSNRTPVAENALIEDGIISCSWHWPEGKNLHFGDRLIRRDSWINLLDPITGESKGKLTHPEGYGVAQDFTWSPDGKSIYSLQRGVTDVYDVPSRKHKAKLFGHDDSATAITFTSDPNIVITGGFDHRIKQWNVKEGKSIREWKGHQQSISSLALIDNGRTMLSASGDHTIRRWRYHQTPGMIDLPSSGEQRTVGAFHWSNGFSSDGSRTIALDQHVYALDIIQAAFGVEGNPMSHRISLLDTKTQRTLQSFKSAWQANAMTHQYMKMIFSPDDRYAAACFRDQPVILDLKTGAEHFLPFRSGSTIAFSPDSQTLATVQHLEQQVYTPSQPVQGIPEYTAPPPEIVPQPETPPEAPKVLPLEFPEPPAYLPNFYSSSFVRLWDVSTRKETAFVVLDQFSCEGIAYSPDGRSMVGWGRGPYLQTGNSFNSSIELRVIDLTTRKQVRVLKGSGLNHRDAAFSPDGKIVVAASWDGNVYVWDVTTGELIHTLRGHQGYIWSACFTPDGKRIISSGNDALLKVWDVVTGEEVISFIDEAGKFRIEFDKRNELVGHGDYVFRRWTTVGK